MVLRRIWPIESQTKCQNDRLKYLNIINANPLKGIYISRLPIRFCG